MFIRLQSLGLLCNISWLVSYPVVRLMMFTTRPTSKAPDSRLLSAFPGTGVYWCPFFGCQKEEPPAVQCLEMLGCASAIPCCLGACLEGSPWNGPVLQDFGAMDFCHRPNCATLTLLSLFYCWQKCCEDISCGTACILRGSVPATKLHMNCAMLECYGWAGPRPCSVSSKAWYDKLVNVNLVGNLAFWARCLSFFLL